MTRFLLASLSVFLFTLNSNAQGQNLAVELDGASQYVDMGDVLNDFDLPFTFSAWVYWNGPGGNGFDFTQGIVTSDYGADILYMGFWLDVRSDSNLTINIGDGTGGFSTDRRSAESPAGVVPVGQWTNVAVVVRGLTDMSFYVDGEDVGVAGYSGTGGNMAHSSRPFYIGRWSYNLAAGDDFLFDGAIDEARLWDRALSQDEIVALKDVILDEDYYNDPDNELVGYWRFDEYEDLGAGNDGPDDFRDFSLLANPGDSVSEPALVPGAPIGTTTNSDSAPTLPETLVLDAPYPNPMSVQSTIGFTLTKSGPVRLAVYDVLGREVAVLMDGVRGAGSHTTMFDARALADGLYLVRLDAGDSVQMQRVTLVK